MGRSEFWRYLGRFLFCALFVLNLASIIWQIGLNPRSRLVQEDNWLWTVPLIILCFVLLSGASLLCVRLWRTEAQKSTTKTMQVALDLGYQEQNLLPLTYAISPLSEPFKARTAGGPVLAWDEDRFKLFVNLPEAKSPYRVLSGARSDCTV